MDVQIWSDVACPWCYVGLKRLGQTLCRVEAPPLCDACPLADTCLRFAGGGAIG